MARRKKPHGGRKLTPERPEKLIAVFRKIGFEVARQSGSHIILVNPEKPLPLAIPKHGGHKVQPEIIKDLLKSAGLTRKEYFELL